MTSTIDRGRALRNRHKLKTVNKVGRARLSCFRSNAHIYAQIIDDEKGVTLVSASTADKKLRKDVKDGSTSVAAEKVGAELAKRAKAAGVSEVYFDRGARRYAGRIKALADAARAGGLQF